MEDSSILKKLIKRYLFAFVFILLIIMLRQSIIQYELKKDTYLSNVVNVAGRQRMLCQQITKDAMALNQYRELEDQNYYLEELRSAVDDWKESNQNLKEGKVNSKTIENSKEIMALFSDIEGNHQSILTAANNIILMIDNGQYDNDGMLDDVNTIKENEPIYLEGMEKIVLLYDKESEDKIEGLSRIELLLFLVLIISILFQLFFVILPGQKEMGNSYRRVLFLSYHDRLTGLYNRYYFDKKVAEELQKTGRIKPSLMILDIDHFKKVNDTWGHPVGDVILKRTAELIQGMVRKTDVVARLGGEEFIIFMPGTDTQGVIAGAEKLRKAIEQEAFPEAGSITASFGTAQMMEGESYVNWYKRVDEALYHAKAGGRNCVISADENFLMPAVTVEMKWHEKWSSGNQEIDEQHRKLVLLGNGLIQAAINEEKPGVIVEYYERLYGHFQKHFEFEEMVMEKNDYPDLDNHRKLHVDMLERMKALQQSYAQGNMKASAFFTFLVDEVITGHIQDEDSKYFKYINKV